MKSKYIARINRGLRDNKPILLEDGSIDSLSIGRFSSFMLSNINDGLNDIEFIIDFIDNNFFDKGNRDRYRLEYEIDKKKLQKFKTVFENINKNIRPRGKVFYISEHSLSTVYKKTIDLVVKMKVDREGIERDNVSYLAENK